MLDTRAGTFTHPDIGRPITIGEAFEGGILNGTSVTIIDPKDKRQYNALEALKSGLMEKSGHINAAGRRLSFADAVREMIIRIESQALVPHGGNKLVQVMIWFKKAF